MGIWTRNCGTRNPTRAFFNLTHSPRGLPLPVIPLVSLHVSHEWMTSFICFPELMYPGLTSGKAPFLIWSCCFSMNFPVGAKWFFLFFNPVLEALGQCKWLFLFFNTVSPALERCLPWEVAFQAAFLMDPLGPLSKFLEAKISVCLPIFPSPVPVQSRGWLHSLWKFQPESLSFLGLS